MNELHDDADQIDALLTRYQVPARVQAGSTNPQTARFYLWLGGSIATTTACVAALTDEIARALGRSDCRLAQQGRSLYLEVPRLPKPTAALPLAAGTARAGLPPGDAALLGLTKNNRPLFVRFPSDEVGHLLVCGAEGCGKTALARAITLSLAEGNHPRRWRLVLLDSRGGLRPLGALPHTWGHAAGVEAAIGWLVRLSAELERRIEESEVALAPGAPLPRLLVVIDDLTAMLSLGGTTVRLALSRLLTRGREMGIHLVATTVQPEPLGALALAFPLRILGQSDQPLGRLTSRWVAPEIAAGLTRGVFLALPSSGTILRFRAAWASSSDVAEEVRRWRHGRQRIVAYPYRPALPPPSTVRPRRGLFSAVQHAK